VFVTVAVIFAEEEFSGSEIGKRDLEEKAGYHTAVRNRCMLLEQNGLKVMFLRCLRVCFRFQDGRGSEVVIERVRRGFQNQVAIGTVVNMVRDLLLHSGREFSL
jgi:hypothetical protein